VLENAPSTNTPRYAFLDFMRGIQPVREHKGWCIFRFKQAYHATEGWMDLYVGYKPERVLIEGLGLNSVLSDIDEAEQA